VAESLTLFEVQAGALLISDRANGYRDRLRYVLKRLSAEQTQRAQRHKKQSARPACAGDPG
jgi:hypothetical protein